MPSLSVVIVTHDNRVSDYADQITRIEDGRIVSRSDARTTSLHLAADNNRARAASDGSYELPVRPVALG